MPSRRVIPPASNVAGAQGQKDAAGIYLPKTPAAPIKPFRLEDFLFDKQLKFVRDPRPYKIAVCSRRAGKTVACAAHLIEQAITTPECVCLYITLTRSSAKKIIWRELTKINTKYKLGGEEDLTELSLTFPNGSTIYCSGAKDEAEIEKFRGLALKICYIDECQSFRQHIKDLIDDVIAPALMDYDGKLCMIGTPGPLPVGYFAEIAGECKDNPQAMAAAEEWSHHKWTYFDNPFIAEKSGRTHDQLLTRELKRRGVSISDPTIQREWFGNWQLDSQSLWIHYNSEKNHFIELPPGKYNYILGIDLGFIDSDALAVIAYSDSDPTTYLVDEVVTPKQGLTELVQQIQALKKKYDISRMIIDEGGLGKKLAEEMRRRHALPVEPADKARKQENVAFLNDSLRTGKFKAKSASKFAQDTFKVEVDRSKSTPERIKLSDKYHSDIIDAVLYAFKESPAYAWQAEEAKPLVGSREWQERQASEMFEAAQKHFAEQAELQARVNNMGFGSD